MIEVLVAVLIMGFVVTASLKLTALSNRGLREVREMEALLREGAILQIKTAEDPLNLFGTNGDISWVVREKSSPLFDMKETDIASLSFLYNSEEATTDSGGIMRRWRELEVTRNGKTVRLFLPKPYSAAASDG
ncbi:MAG: hypothetical protein FWE55_03965 [Synergistaceae bacterium]|nr:hypothetical protein [Synergistaceae bacterium]